MPRNDTTHEDLTYDVITRMIIEAMASQRNMHFPHVHVEVDDGIVTLSGQVEAVSEKIAAEYAASHVPDVTHVVNHIKVIPPEFQDDDAIALAVKESLDRDVRLDSRYFEVMVTGGVVDIRGEVITDQEKRLALDDIHGTAGVVEVVDHINVLPEQSSSDHILEEEVTATLQRTAEIDGKNIQVHVDNNTVYLSGRIVTQHQKTELERVVAGIPGVDQIADDVIVEHHFGG